MIRFEDYFNANPDKNKVWDSAQIWSFAPDTFMTFKNEYNISRNIEDKIIGLVKLKTYFERLAAQDLADIFDSMNTLRNGTLDEFALKSFASFLKREVPSSIPLDEQMLKKFLFTLNTLPGLSFAPCSGSKELYSESPQITFSHLASMHSFFTEVVLATGKLLKPLPPKELQSVYSDEMIKRQKNKHRHTKIKPTGRDGNVQRLHLPLNIVTTGHVWRDTGLRGDSMSLTQASFTSRNRSLKGSRSKNRLPASELNAHQIAQIRNSLQAIFQPHPVYELKTQLSCRKDFDEEGLFACFRDSCLTSKDLFQICLELNIESQVNIEEIMGLFSMSFEMTVNEFRKMVVPSKISFEKKYRGLSRSKSKDFYARVLNSRPQYNDITGWVESLSARTRQLFKEVLVNTQAHLDIMRPDILKMLDISPPQEIVTLVSTSSAETLSPSSIKSFFPAFTPLSKHSIEQFLSLYLPREAPDREYRGQALRELFNRLAN